MHKRILVRVYWHVKELWKKHGWEKGAALRRETVLFFIDNNKETGGAKYMGDKTIHFGMEDGDNFELGDGTTHWDQVV